MFCLTQLSRGLSSFRRALCIVGRTSYTPYIVQVTNIVYSIYCNFVNLPLCSLYMYVYLKYNSPVRRIYIYICVCCVIVYEHVCASACCEFITTIHRAIIGCKNVQCSLLTRHSSKFLCQQILSTFSYPVCVSPLFS